MAPRISQQGLPLQEQWARKSRFLTQALIFSGALNIGLLTSFFYLILRDKQEAVVFELPPKEEGEEKALSLQVLSQLAQMPYAALVEMLDNRDPVEAGYKKCDLALASLVAFHFIDVDKALQGAAIQRRTVSFQREGGPEQVHITVFPGLTVDHLKAIAHFIKTERFPVTAQGLFYELKQPIQPKDPVLLQTFYLTAEYTMLSTLFNRVGLTLPASYLIDLITEGEWELLKRFTEEQKEVQDFSALRLKHLLSSYIKGRSLLAAKILVQWDREFILKKFEDADLMTCLDLFSQRTESVEIFLKELITSSRSDAVWKKAAEKLYAFANIPLPDPYDHQKTVQLFAQSHIAASPKKVAVQGARVHIVAPGDNLWKIARQYKVSIEAIRQANHLESDRLRPGKKLTIPE
jgi:hypothetical protein